MALTDVELNLGAGGAKIGVDTISGTSYEVVKQAFGATGSVTQVDDSNPLPVIDLQAETTLQDILSNMATSAKQDTNTNTLALLTLAQNSTTAAQLGTLMQGATTTAAPSYTTARTNPLSLTTAGALRTDSSATTQPVSIAAPTSIYHNKKTVTTAGTRVVLASSQAVRSVCIKALITNTGYIYIGDSSLSSTNGFQLLAGDTVSLDISNLNTIYIDSSVSGEGVTYISSN